MRGSPDWIGCPGRNEFWSAIVPRALVGIRLGSNGAIAAAELTGTVDRLRERSARPRCVRVLVSAWRALRPSAGAAPATRARAALALHCGTGATPFACHYCVTNESVDSAAARPYIPTFAAVPGGWRRAQRATQVCASTAPKAAQDVSAWLSRRSLQDDELYSPTTSGQRPANTGQRRAGLSRKVTLGPGEFSNDQ